MTLTVEQLSGRGRGGELVHQVSLEVAPGECLTVLGRPECGTRLLLRLLAGQAWPSQGRIWLDGHEVSGLPAARRPLQLVNLEAPLPARRSLAELSGAALREDVVDLLGLSGLEAEPLGRLSTMLRPKAALALALARRPAVLLLAEPGRGLSSTARNGLYELLTEVCHALGLGVLVATAEPEAAFALAGRVAVMHGGRLLEAGSAQEIYLRPQTDVGAAALGPVNLLVGRCTDDGVRVGPFVFATRLAGGPGEGQPRVQLMFRPEDVELAGDSAELGGTTLGQAEVVSLCYGGAIERLRLRLPAIRGVRPVAPAPPFGEPGLLIDVARPAEQARRRPLRPGDKIWAGVRRFHALPHPGLHLAVVGPEAPAAHQLADLAAARLSCLKSGDEPPEVALARLHRHLPCDVVLLASRAPAALALIDRLLERSPQHLLLLDELRRPPRTGLICIAGHEGDKTTVQFAGRLLRHLGASASLLTVLPSQATALERVERFHAAARETLAALGVPASSCYRTGAPAAEILAERREGSYDLLVVGAQTLPHRGPRLLHALVHHTMPSPLLVVRPTGLVPPGQREHAGLMGELFVGPKYA